MKNLFAVCLLVALTSAGRAQVLSSADATAKPKPLEPIVAREHRGAGRIGATLSFPKDQMPQISELTKGGPAADAGFKIGDVIVKIDKNFTNTLTTDEVNLALHGQPGSGVQLTVQRGDDPKYIIRAVERRVLPANAENLLESKAIPSSPELSPPTTP